MLFNAALSFLLTASAAYGIVILDDTITLPKALSDLTATLAPNDLVYIAGGCDSEKGNEFLANAGSFACFSLSNSFYVFDPKKNKVVQKRDMPRVRYRHGAAAVNNQIWLVGGRDGMDAHVNAVDVYDIATDSWTTPGILPGNYNTSDNACFSDNTHIYTVGGYDNEYTALDTVFRIDTTQDGLVIDETEPLREPRGDVQAVVTSDQTTAYVTGGFTHVNSFCDALGSVEKYDFSNKTWSAAPSLVTGRADKALVQLNGKIFALGGETQIENLCTVVDPSTIDLWQRTVAVDDVEVLDGNKWTVLASLEEHRFRFAGVGFDATNTFYTFGGQEAYQDDCQCFRASNQITLYENSMEEDPPDSSGSNYSTIAAKAIVIAAALFSYMV